MINLSEAVKNDIGLKSTYLTPLIVIYSDPNIYISTNKGIFDENIFFEDYNLSISTLTDTINVKTKRFQTNKINFTLSNYEVDGKRFSDFIYERGLLNKNAEVYYKTQSCKNLSDCILIFKGKIKNLNHDSKKCKIDLEDLTEDKLNKIVPVENLGHSNNLYNETYKNRPIPILYGKVDRAPAVPFVENLSAHDQISIKVIPDAVSEVVNPNRNIEVAGFDSNNTNYLIHNSEESNPLYIYKDDYYQVLKNYNKDILQGGEDSEDWDWDEEEQYTTNNGYVQIRKIFRGVIPSNPPAFNEFQCVKVRFPKQLFLQGNSLEESEVDQNGYSFLNIQEDVRTPEFAFDNQLEFSTNSNINPNIYNTEYQNYYDSAALIPADEIIGDVEEITYWNGVRMHQYADNSKGVMLSAQNAITWGHRIYEWLYFFSYSFNTNYEDPSIVFKQFPSHKGMKKRAAEIINQELLATGNYTESQVSASNWDVYRSGRSYRGNQPQFTYESGDYEGLSADDTNMDWFVENENESCPQPFFIYNELTNSLTIKEDLGYDAIAITMNNNTFNMNNPLSSSFTNVKVFNVFNLNDGHPYLFETEEFREFIPLEITNSSQSLERLHFRSFRAIETYTNNNLNYFDDGHDMDDSDRWFGSYGLYYEGWNAARTRETDVFNGQWQSWVLWVKKDIPAEEVGYARDLMSDYGAPVDSPFDPSNYNEAKGKIKINANTIFPATHRASYSSNSGSGTSTTIYYGSQGTKDYTNPGYFKIQYRDINTGEPDMRLSLIFPFGDLNISDNIHTDTFFHGKIHCIFSQLTTNVNNSNFVLYTAPVEQDDLDVNMIDSEIATNLISKPLSQCVYDEQWWSSDPRDYPIYDTNNEIISNQENQNYTDTNGLARLDFFDTSTYTALNLTYRIDGFGLAAGSDNPALLFTRIHNVGLLHYIVFENALESNFYLDASGRVDTIPDQNGNISYELAETPSKIFKDFLINELSFNEDVIDTQVEDEVHNSDKYGFSIKDEKKAKSFIEDFSKDTKVFPKFRSDGTFTYASIKNQYNNDDVNLTINASDIISYKWKRTSISDINTIVNVKFTLDYETDNYLHETGYVDGYDMFGNGDGIIEEAGLENGYSYNYLGLEREDKVLEYESKYIRDRDTAERLRDFLYMFNCNQHNIINAELPISYINLEAGDVIDFDSLIDNLKAYGEDYTDFETRNGQLIYPYFIITKIQKKLNKVIIEAMQLHSLNSTFEPAIGSVSRMKKSGQESFIYLTDYLELEEYLSGGNKYFTNKQKNAADINSDGILGDQDLQEILELQNYVGENILGDLNVDGFVNVVDIIQLVNQITSQEEATSFEMQIGDVNNDGIVNVLDIIEIVSQLTNE
jgi:hypothetical protein